MATGAATLPGGGCENSRDVAWTLADESGAPPMTPSNTVVRGPELEALVFGRARLAVDGR